MKLKNYRTFWILSILYFVSVPGINIIGWNLEQRAIEKQKIVKALGLSFGYPDLWQTVSYLSSFMLFIPALMVILFVTNEFMYKTHRQNIIDGWSRSEFIWVKILLALIASIISTILVFISVLIVGSLGDTHYSTNGMKYIGYFFIQSISYFSLALMLGVLIKRTALALGVFLFYATIFETIVSAIMNRWIPKKPGNYLFLNTTDNLIPFPFIKNISNKLLDKPDLSLLLILAAIYLSAYLFISVRRIQRSDL